MSKLRKIIFIFSVFIFLGCSLLLGLYQREMIRSQKTFQELSQHKAYLGSVKEEDIEVGKQQAKEDIRGKKDKKIERPSSPDYVGWVSIEDTPISYPVMQNKEEPEYYLNRDFYGNDSYSGTPFLDATCDGKDKQGSLLIYGHNMKNGTIFSSLREYHSAQFLKEHPYILFEVGEEISQYRVFAVLQSEGDEDAFDLLSHVAIGSREEYVDFVTLLKEKAIYDTGVLPKTQSQLLFLVTCTNGYDKSGRLIVAAYKM